MVALLFHPSSYLGIFVFLVLTGCGMPIPEEVAFVVAGLLCAEGSLLIWPALAACLLGAIVGDCVMYAIGYHGGHRLLRRHPRLAKLLGADREKRLEESIERHSFKVMLLSRFLVGIRGPVYVAAGVMRIPFRRFLLYDLLGASLVVVLFFSLAYAYGDDVVRWVSRAERTATVLVLLVAIAVGGLLYYRHRQFLMRAILDGDPLSRR